MKEYIQHQSCYPVAQKQRSNNGISIVDNRPSHNEQMNLKNTMQRVRVATNVDCPSWGNVLALGSYIHGLFQTEFLSGAGAPVLAAAGPAVANRSVEQPNGIGGISDFLQVFPGGIAFAELKPNTAVGIAAGVAAMGGLNQILGLALPPIPLNGIDPGAQPQPMAGPPIYAPVPPNPAPAPGAMPDVHFNPGPPGVYVYDAY